MLEIQARPLKALHDEQYRSDQPVLLVVPFELGFCLVYGAADSLLNMAPHDVPTGKLQLVGILNRRRNADNCVRYLLYYFASDIFDYICVQTFCTCIVILGVVLSRQVFLDYGSFLYGCISP